MEVVVVRCDVRRVERVLVECADSRLARQRKGFWKLEMAVGDDVDGWDGSGGVIYRVFCLQGEISTKRVFSVFFSVILTG